MGIMWDKVAKSEYGPLLSTDGSLDTWSWSLNVPVLNSLSEDDEVRLAPCLFCDVVVDR